LIVMVGAPGSGKSYLAQIVASSIGAKLIQTDAVRKELFPRPRYTPAEASAVYAACHQRIREALGQGKRVVFDGTNLRERRRLTLYQIAERAGAALTIVAAYAPESVIRARLEQRLRARTPGDVSDADWRIYLQLRHDAEPIPRLHIVANTVAAPGPVVRLLRRHLEEPLPASAERGERRGRAGSHLLGPSLSTE
jgi:predicted kinase